MPLSLISQFARWIARKLNRSRIPQKRVLKEFFSDQCAIHLIEDSSIPGNCAYWRVRHLQGTGTFCLIVVNLAAMEEEISRQGRSSSVAPPAPRQLAEELERQIVEQSWVMSTHYWITGWLTTSTRRDRKGRSYLTQQLTIPHLIACDLQGYGGAWAGDMYALRIAQKSALRVGSSVDRRKYFNYHSPEEWEEVVKGINWLAWLEGYTRSPSGGIAPEHILQPRKPDRRKVGGVKRLSQ